MTQSFKCNATKYLRIYEMPRINEDGHVHRISNATTGVI